MLTSASIFVVCTQETVLKKWTAKNPPRFEEFPVNETWQGPNAAVKITTRSERMFRTRLTNAAKDASNFAGHYRFTVWRCGSECVSGAIVDLQTGTVFSPPSATNGAPFSVCQSAFENAAVDFRLDSRLVIIRCGLNYLLQLDKNIPDAHYYLWGESRSRELLFVSGKLIGN